MIISLEGPSLVKIGKQCRTFYMKTRFYVCIVDSCMILCSSTAFRVLWLFPWHQWLPDRYAVCTLPPILSVLVPRVSDTDSYLIVPIYVNL